MHFWMLVRRGGSERKRDHLSETRKKNLNEFFEFMYVFSREYYSHAEFLKSL